MSQHTILDTWVKECADMCKPDEVIWISGSESEKDALIQEALSNGEIIELDQQKHPGCYYHRTAINDVARTENLTCICTSNHEEAGPNNNWKAPAEAYALAKGIFQGCMQGRKMYVIPFCMGPIDSPYSKIGVELTDSIYVVLNMRIVTRIGQKVLDRLGNKGEFTKCLHSKADLNIDRRWILHFPEDNTIWSVGSGYGGNVLLGKKCLSLRIASYLGRKEDWLAEHMLILGIQDPKGQITYVAAAFPSACGKTNLAMLIPPDVYIKEGWKIWTVGDDIAWMHIGEDGQLYAINPESGFFGVAPGTNSKTNPNAVKTVARNTIFTNVVLAEDNTVWWEGGDGIPPSKGMDWQGRPWTPTTVDKDGKKVEGAHANSRFTTPASQCPSISPHWEDPQGVPISAIIFGGRRAQLAPLVYEAFDWQHGVHMGATMASERTAAQFGKIGEIRRDPMAMLPFCGYNMGDYFAHWLKMGERIKTQPKIFHVNWFRTDDNGKFLWPGFGENMRVLEWIIERCNGNRLVGHETEIGIMPEAKDIRSEGLNITKETMEELLAIKKKHWSEELKWHSEFFSQYGSHIPQGIWDEHRKLEKRLALA